MQKKKVIQPQRQAQKTFESLGYDPEVMEKFGYETLDDFLAVQDSISPEQMKWLKICNQNATTRAPKKSIQILDSYQKNASVMYASPRHASQQIEKQKAKFMKQQTQIREQ